MHKKIRYIHYIILVFLISSAFNFSIASSSDININNLTTAKDVAQTICQLAAGGHDTKFDKGIQVILDDHSYGDGYAAYRHNDSYFRTDRRQDIEGIARDILNNASAYKIYWEGSTRRLALIKTFTKTEAQQFTGKDYIGRCNRDYSQVTAPSVNVESTDQLTGHDRGVLTNIGVLFFDITDITGLTQDKTNVISRSNKKGSFNTGFPVAYRYYTQRLL